VSATALIDIGQWPLVTYVDDVTTAMSEAKRAAGERNVEGEGGVTHLHYRVKRA